MACPLLRRVCLFLLTIRACTAQVYWSSDIAKAKNYDRGVILKLSVRCGKTKRIDSQGHPLQKTWSSQGYDTAWVPANCGMVNRNLTENCTVRTAGQLSPLIFS